MSTAFELQEKAKTEGERYVKLSEFAQAHGETINILRGMESRLVVANAVPRLALVLIPLFVTLSTEALIHWRELRDLGAYYAS